MFSNIINLRDFLKTLPNLPGVYRMLDVSGQVLYIGKAVNLKRRVSGYFQKTDLSSPRIVLMVKQVVSIDITVTRSEAEALVLENNLIKALSPKYNIVFRDDKTYPYLMVSAHLYPKISYYRGSPKKPNQYFGPFPNSYAVRDSIEILQKVFLLRTCEDSVFQNRQRPCLLHQIKRCSAPCVNLITSEDYAQSVEMAISFLEGKQGSLITIWTRKMEQAAENLAFEQAARFRNQIQALNQIQEKQFVDSRYNQKSIDVLAVVEELGLICVYWASIRGGRYVGDKSFFLKSVDNEKPNLKEYLNAFVSQHYLGKAKPELILSNLSISSSLIKALNQDADKKIEFIHRTVGERRVWLNMAEKNAHQTISQKLAQQSTQASRLKALSQVLQIEDIQRLECFDISHTQGEATVASCVVYDKGDMQPTEYRRFNIESTDTGDDYIAMKEVLTRHYGKRLEQQAKLPDVVLIDGGKGQVGVAEGVWEELGLNIPIIGIAKGSERKAGLEELILPYLNSTLQLAPNHMGLHLLQTVRDEAHRFAITGHRARRSKARVQSSLQGIPGIGAKRKKQLLIRFGGMRGIVAASVDDLAQVEGISLALAERIYAVLH